MAPPGGPRLAPRRRRWSRLTAGVVTVLACLFGFLAASSAVLGAHATQVLAVARAVPAGAALTPADLAVVAMHPAAGVATLPASDQGQLVGRTTAVPLTAGTLLSAADLGPPHYPSSGEAIVALALSAGAFPPQMQAGARVAVMDGRAGSSGSGQQPAGPATVMVGLVTAITPGDGAGGTQTVVSLLVDTAAVPAVEQLASPVLVVLDPSGTDMP
jgi:SAF domain